MSYITPDSIKMAMIDYTVHYMAGALPQKVKLTVNMHIHVFSNVCVQLNNTFIHGFARPQQVKFTLPGYVFTHMGFPSVHVVLSITFVPGFVMIMD